MSFVPIKYTNNHFRSQNLQPLFLLPEDDAEAQARGFDKCRKITMPFLDDTAGKIVALIGQKGWDIPGIEIEFNVSDCGTTPVHYIRHIRGTIPGKKWHLKFSNSSYECEDRGIATALSEVIIPKHEISICNDGGGHYISYVGDDWLEDEEFFHHSTKMHAKLDSEPRRYLTYDKRDDSFVHNNDLGRQYDPIGNEPTTVHFIEMAAHMDFFFDPIIEELKALPDSPEGTYGKWARLAHIDAHPAMNVPTLRVHQSYQRNDKDKGILVPENNRVFCSSDYTHSEMHPVPDLAKGYFSYGFPVDRTPPDNERHFWSDNPRHEETHFYEVNLKYTNDIYVVDEEPFWSCRHNLAVETLDRPSFTEEEIAEMYSVMTRTIVPLSEYKDDYKMPLYLIHRPLWSDEAKDITQDIRINEKKRPSIDLSDTFDLF